jgi:hypothetical protein
LQHGAGIIIVYKNDTPDKTLVENLEFNMTGLEIVGQEGETKTEVKCGPGETKDVQLNAVGNGYQFGMSMGYYIEG